MTIEERLKEAQDKRQGLVNQANQLDQDKQNIIMEIFRSDGRIEILTKLRDEEGSCQQKNQS